MTLEQRKIQLAQSMLRLEDEQIVTSVEKLMKDIQLRLLDNNVSPLTQEELSKRIAESEDDFANDRFTSAESLLKKF